METLSSCAYQLVVIDGGSPSFDLNGEPTSTGGTVNLGVPRWGRKIKTVRVDEVLETTLGRRWIFKRFDRRTFGFTFRLTPDNFDLFRELDEAVGGQRDPFLFYPYFDVDPDLAIFVRKSSEFDEGSEQPGIVSGSIARINDYELVVTEEPTGTTVTA